MKKWFLISILIVVAVGPSESRDIDVPQEESGLLPEVISDRIVTLRGRKQPVPRIKRLDDNKVKMENDCTSAVKCQQVAQVKTQSQESIYLKEIAEKLSIPVFVCDTPGDIAFRIIQRVESAEQYRGEILSEESFKKAKSTIRIPADAETFAEYHKFIKRIEGKKLLICGEGKEK